MFFLLISVEPLIPTVLFISFSIILLQLILNQAKLKKKMCVRENEIKIFENLLSEFYYLYKECEKANTYVGEFRWSETLSISYEKFLRNEIDEVNLKISDLTLYLSDVKEREDIKWLFLLEENTNFYSGMLEKNKRKYICNYKIINIKQNCYTISGTYETDNYNLEMFNDDLNIYHRLMINNL